MDFLCPSARAYDIYDTSNEVTPMTMDRDDDFTTQFTTVHAERGWYFMDRIRGDNGTTGYDRVPVLAWVIEVCSSSDGELMHTVAHPVTSEALGPNGDNNALLRPDGWMVLPSGERFFTEAELMDHHRALELRYGMRRAEASDTDV